ncbi:MAG: hypothetical protein HXS44_11070 [Theionarchaea archaeon]|nr:hypothetical protein [Theionarchaea archaeon]
MDKKHYETALLLAAGMVLGQILALFFEVSYSIWSFIPILLMVGLFGGISLRTVSRNKSLTSSGATTRILTGVWIFLVWELVRMRLTWLVDIPKFVILTVIFLFFYRIVKKKWEE